MSDKYTLTVKSVGNLDGDQVAIPDHDLGLHIETTRPNGWRARYSIYVQDDGSIRIMTDGAGQGIVLSDFAGNALTISLQGI